MSTCLLRLRAHVRALKAAEETLVCSFHRQVGFVVICQLSGGSQGETGRAGQWSDFDFAFNKQIHFWSVKLPRKLRGDGGQRTMKNLDCAVEIQIYVGSIKFLRKLGWRGSGRQEGLTVLLACRSMWDLSTFLAHLDKEGKGGQWEDVIAPSMKKVAVWAIMCAQDLVQNRKGTCELYGWVPHHSLEGRQCVDYALSWCRIARVLAECIGECHDSEEKGDSCLGLLYVLRIL